MRLRKVIRIAWLICALICIFAILKIVGLYQDTPDLLSPEIAFEIKNLLVFLPIVPFLVYAEYTLETQTRRATQISILTILLVLSVQQILNGGMEDTSLFFFPAILLLATFFTNKSFVILCTLAMSGLIIILTICEVVGMKPLNPTREGFFSIEACIHLNLMLVAMYVLVQVVTHDIYKIQKQLLTDNQKAEFLATHDTLTGLPNRYYSEQHVEYFFSNALAGEGHYVLFIDVDNFKTINTRFRHKGGDATLKVIAERLQTIASEHHAIACRIGGDEFMILLTCPPNEVDGITQSVLIEIAEPFDLFDETLEVTCSIGITQVETGADFQTVYQQADTAMHRAKHLGKNTQVRHQQVFSDEELFRIEMLNELRHAIKRDELILKYQPQIDLKTQQVVGLEALIRWNKQGKELLPGDFIPLAEQYGLIQPISNWVIQQACRDCKEWHRQGYQHLVVAVNVSAVLLKHSDLFQTVSNNLAAVDLLPCYLELELTESAVSKQSDQGYVQLQKLHELGVTISIDDFGTGYSNLQRLGQLDIRRIKIDHSFVMRMPDSQQSYDLVAAIIGLAERLQLQTVAEGVEQAVVADMLKKLNCRVGQGFFWSEALSQQELFDYLELRYAEPYH